MLPWRRQDILPAVMPVLAATRAWVVAQIGVLNAPIFDAMLVALLATLAITFWCMMASSFREISWQLFLGTVFALVATGFSQILLLAIENAIENNPMWLHAAQAALTERAFAALNGTLFDMTRTQ